MTRDADKLEAMADWFTDCKTLTLERLPTGLIEALRAGVAALTSQAGSAPRTCPHCGFPAVLPEICTPAVNEAIERGLAHDSEMFDAGRQHEAQHRLLAGSDPQARQEWQAAPSTPSQTAAKKEEMFIEVPEVVWALGDPEQSTTSGVTITTRPIYYKGKRAGTILRDYGEPLMAKLLAPPAPPSAPERPHAK